MDLSLCARVQGRAAVVQADGDIDVFTAPLLRERLAELIRAGHHHLVVDMESVTFLDSTGLGVLVGARRKVHAHEGSVRVICTHERIIKIFRITGLTGVFPIHTSLDEAIATLREEIPGAAAGPAPSEGTSRERESGSVIAG